MGHVDYIVSIRAGALLLGGRMTFRTITSRAEAIGATGRKPSIQRPNGSSRRMALVVDSICTGSWRSCVGGRNAGRIVV